MNFNFMFYFILNRDILTKKIRTLTKKGRDFFKKCTDFFLKEFGEKMKLKNEILKKIQKKIAR